MMYAQKPAAGTRPTMGGKRIIANIELEVDSAGAKLNCRTTTSVASVCRDLGGVYDPNGVPNCLFALADMSCGNGPNDYIHDIVNGAPVCRVAGNNCLAPSGLPGNYYAIGVTNGILECRRLTRRVVASTAPPSPPPPPSCPAAGTSTAGSGGAAAPAGCMCNNAGETWDAGTSTCVAAPTGTYWKMTNQTFFFADGSTTCTFSNITTATCSPQGSECKITTTAPMTSGGAMCNYCLSGGPYTWYYTCSNCEAPGTLANVCDPSASSGTRSTTACCSGSINCTNGSTMGTCN